MKRLFSFLVSGLVALSTWAIPAQPGTFTVRQSDGTVITLRMVGDEFCHYYINVDTGQKMLQDDNGNYYAISEAQLQTMETFGIQQRNFVNAQRMERLAAYQGEAPAVTGANGPARFPGRFNKGLKGERHGLVLLVNFSDVKFQDKSAEFYERFFNEEGFSDNNAIGSVHDYFKDQSYGIFQPKFDVIGPIELPQDMNYYGSNDPVYHNDKRAAEMLYHGVKIAKEEMGSALDFSKYDWDGDSEVDLVFVIYPGYAESYNAPSNTVWPHAYRMSWARQSLGADCNPLYYDKVKIDGYACAQELTGKSGTRKVGIGVACHEFSHCIGYPDFYDTSGGNSFGFNYFDIMETGSYSGPNGNCCDVPCGYSAYERWMAGWLTPTELAEGANVTDMPAIGDAPSAYIIYNEGNTNEYFLLENRRSERWHRYVSSSVSGSGLFVSHYDYDSKVWIDNGPNNDATHRRATYVPANRSYASTDAGAIRGAFFPGTTGATTLDDATYANFGMRLFNKHTNGTYFLNAPLTDIYQSANGLISFRFKDGTDTGERYSVTLEAGSGTCETTVWTQTRRGEVLELPSATVNLKDWHFLGWSTENVTTTETRPGGLLTDGAEYKPTQDVTLYAVYGYTDSTIEEGEDYVKSEEIVPGKQYVFANKGAKTTVALYAIDADVLTASAKASITGKTVSIDFEQNPPVISNPDESIVWLAKQKGNGFTLEHDGRYLSLTANGFALSSNPSTFTLHKTWGLSTTLNGTSYYVQSGKGAFSVQTGTGSSTARCFPYQKGGAGDMSTLFSTWPEGTPIDPSGITTLTTTTSSPTQTYDLQGRRIQSAAGAKGLRIEDGRRIIR